MQRCPQCGTELDDSKRKCYMCGADLMTNSNTQFGDSFDSQLGAMVTNSNDNVFNSVASVTNDFSNPQMNNDFSSNNNIGFNTFNNEPTNPISPPPNNYMDTPSTDENNYSSSGADYYGEEPKEENPFDNNNGLNGLNSMQYDNRSALEKIFSSNRRFKSKDEMNEEMNVTKGFKFGKKKETQPTPPSNVPQMNPMQSQPNNDLNSGMPTPMMNNMNNVGNMGIPPLTPPSNIQPEEENPINSFIGMTVSKDKIKPVEEPTGNKFFKATGDNPTEQSLAPKEKKQKKKINWAEINAKDDKKYKKLDKKTKNIDKGLITNVVVFLVFIIAVIIVYFIFFKPSEDNSSSFGGLVYYISDNFVLKQEEKNSRYYTYGDNCALQIKYGTATGENSFVGNYFDSVREKYSKQEGYITQEETMNIGGNNWSSLSVLQLVPNDASPSGTQTIVKYKYVSMIYNNNYYQIVYSNTDNNNECSAMYEQMIESMEFEEPKK